MFNTMKEHSLSSLSWFLLVAVSVPLGYAIGNFLTRNTSDANGTTGIGIIALLLVIGLFIGVGQWIALNSRIKVGWTWIPATAIGFVFGCIVSYLIIAFVVEGLLNMDDYSGRFYAIYDLVEFIATFLGAGILTGTLQWLALEGVMQTSTRWIMVSGLSFAGSFILAYLITDFFWVSHEGIGIIFAIIFGLVFALLTAIPAERLICD